MSVKKLDVTMISGEDKDEYFRIKRRQGWSERRIREGFEEMQEEYVAILTGIPDNTLPYVEKLRLMRPYTVARMVNELGMMPKEAEKAYDCFVAREEVRHEQVDRWGMPIGDDEGYAIAKEATSSRSSAGFLRRVGMHVESVSHFVSRERRSITMSAKRIDKYQLQA